MAPAAKPSLSAQADTPAAAGTVVDKAKAASNSAAPGNASETVALADKQAALPAAAKAEGTAVAMGS